MMDDWKIYRVLALLCSFNIRSSVFGQVETWSVLQYKGLDDLYLEFQQSAEVAKDTDPTTIQIVCDSIPVGFRASNYRSGIRGQIRNVNVDNANGFQRHILNDLLEVDLFPCTRKHFLTRGYESENTYFLFVYDSSTREVALMGLLQKDVSTLCDEPDPMGVKCIEDLYMAQKKSFDKRVSKQKYPQNPNPVSSLGDPAVCALSVGQKLRLCALTLNTQYYKRKYIFTPSVENVDAECLETPLLLTSYNIKDTENMYRCYVNDVHKPARRTTVYLSRSYRDYEIFVYEFVERVDDSYNLVKLDNSVGWIAFVEEPKVDVRMLGLIVSSPDQHESHQPVKVKRETIEAGTSSRPIIDITDEENDQNKSDVITIESGDSDVEVIDLTRDQ